MGSVRIEGIGSVEVLRANRTLGISPGDLGSVIRKETVRILKEAGGNQQKAVTLGLRRMSKNGLITRNDLRRLEKLNLILLRVDAGKLPPGKASAAVDALFRDSLDDPASSEMGSTMVGASYSARNSTVAPAAGLFGMLIGALLTGGSGGMLIGGLIGWGIGKVCGDEED